jgi:MFS family permease
MQQFVEYVQRFGRFQRNARLYLLANALTGISGGIILVLYTLYLSALGYGTNLIGLILFVATLGVGLAIFPAGLCVDRFSGKAVLIWSTALIGIAGVGQMLFRNPILLCTSVFLVGVGIAFQFALNAPFLTTNSTPAERAHLFSLNIVISLVTTVLGELLGGALPLGVTQWLQLHGHAWTMFPLPLDLSWMLVSDPLARSYQITLLFAGLIATPGFIPLFLMTDDHPTSVRSEQQHSWSFHHLFASIVHFCTSIVGTGSAQGTIPTAPVRKRVTGEFSDGGKPRPYGRTGQTLLSLAFWRRLHTFLLSPLATMIGVNILIGFGAGMLLPYFSLFFVQHLGATSALFGVIDGAANILNAVGTLLAPLIAMRFGRVATILLPRLLAVPVMLCIGISTLLPLAAILYPLRQGLTDMPNGILQVFSMEVVPPQQRGLANSSYQSANQVAWAAATPIGGIIISHLGYTPVFLLTAIFYLLALALIWWRFGDKRI